MKAIRVLGYLWAVLGLVMVLGSVNGFLYLAIVGPTEGERESLGLMIASGVAQVLLGAMLLVASAGVLRKKGWGRGLLEVACWAFLMLVIATIGFWSASLRSIGDRPSALGAASAGLGFFIILVLVVGSIALLRSTRVRSNCGNCAGER